MKRSTRVAVIALMVLAIAVTVLFFVVPNVVDRRMNTVVPTSMQPVSEEAKALHATLFVADMHADELLWGRDPLERVGAARFARPRDRGCRR